MIPPSSPPTVAIVTVGDELLTGDIVDRHSAWLSHHLTSHGYRVETHLSAGDAPGALARSLTELPAAPEIVLIVGGLGPTEDDRTRNEIATAVGVDVQFRDSAWEVIAAYFRRIGREPVERNRRQAFFPRGAQVIDNRFGTAPAFRLTAPAGGDWWALPGVPHEMHGLFHEDVLPALLADHPPPRDEPMAEFRFFGISESELDGWLTRQVPADQHSGIHLCCGDGELRVRLDRPWDLGTPAHAEYGTRYLGSGGASLQQRVVDEAVAGKATIAVAESCTGGLLGARITDVPGASAAFAGGWIAYSNALKESQLGVSAATLEEHGAVSAHTAREMAHGARAASGATLAAAITGVAGPGGGSDPKPVGTVYVGVAFPGGVCSKLLNLRGERDRIRSLAANHALSSLLRVLRGDTLPNWARADTGAR